MPKYRVTLQCQAWMECEVTVEANSGVEAEDKALKIPKEDLDWDSTDVDEDTIEVCGIYQKEGRKKKETAAEDASGPLSS